MAIDKILYLNLPQDEHPMLVGSLLASFRSLPGKLVKAPGTQWVQTVRSLLNKGVKQVEIDDVGLIEYLNKCGKETVLRTDIESFIVRRQVTIKEVVLGSPKFQRYSEFESIEKEDHDKSSYAELLYVANSEQSNMDDRLEEIDWEIEEFNFDIERLSNNPEALFKLEDERAAIMRDKPKAYDFEKHHFSDVVTGKHGKNLIAHGRELIYKDLYFINEVQSDWAQKGRKNNWTTIPKGPFVTETKLWAGLVVRRMIQRAAMNPKIKQVAWIRGNMRNGWSSGSNDGLDEFYLKVIPGIANKAIGGGGGKCRMGDVKVGTKTLKDVAMFDMTDDVRKEILSKSLPLYSMSQLRDASDRRELHEVSDVEIEYLQDKAKGMLGSKHHLRLVRDVFDISTGKQVAGRYVSGMIWASINAANSEFVLNHEAYHYAEEKLLSYRERKAVEAEFMPGTQLNNRVKDLLIRSNDRAAAEQCSDPREAAAHGFALWSTGALPLRDDIQSAGIFAAVKIVLQDGLAWLNRLIHDNECTSAEEVFEGLRSGYLSKRAEHERASESLIQPEKPRF